MITISINKLDVSPNALWYHYKNEVSNGLIYELIITNDEKDILDLIEKYGQCDIRDEAIKQKIIDNDALHRSNGLMWHILNHIQKMKNSDDEFNWEWVINNIMDIELKNNQLKIIGQVSVYKTG